MPGIGGRCGHGVGPRELGEEDSPCRVARLMAEHGGVGRNAREILDILWTHGAEIATLKTAVGSIQNEQHNISAMPNKMNEP